MKTYFDPKTGFAFRLFRQWLHEAKYEVLDTLPEIYIVVYDDNHPLGCDRPKIGEHTLLPNEDLLIMAAMNLSKAYKQYKKRKVYPKKFDTEQSYGGFDGFYYYTTPATQADNSAVIKLNARSTRNGEDRNVTTFGYNHCASEEKTNRWCYFNSYKTINPNSHGIISQIMKELNDHIDFDNVDRF